ncbi:MAG: glycoside hydrolase family 28 protein [Acholeplasma sp.]|jgi:polygalacturonase|nr:MAG: glycoside hydrolase family 28 protein [Acholeplasma sp.]
MHIVFISSRSVTFELNNTNIYYAEKPYDVYIDQTLALENVITNVFSIYDLIPETTYEITVLGEVLTFQTERETAILNVKDFGARGDGITDDTEAIQRAIYRCPAKGLVHIPEGQYLVRPLFLKSHQTIELVKYATLLGDTQREHYPILPAQVERRDGSLLELSSWEGVPQNTFASTLTGIEVVDVKIIGEGIIDEQAHLSDWWIDHKILRGAWRPKGIFLSHCENIGIQGITVTNTPSWNLHPYFCHNIDFIDMSLISPKDSPNTDGCNPESSDHINIIGVNFSVGDDCIAIKSGKYDMGMKYHQPTSDMVVRNCMMAHGHGAVVLGSEMSGGIKNLTVTQCYFKQTDRGLRIKTRRGRGQYGIIDGITFTNIYMEDVLTPLVINMYYYCDEDGKTEYVWSKEALPVDHRTPYLGEFTFKDIVCKNVHVAAGFFYGLPEQPIKRITLDHIDISYATEIQSGIPAMMSFLDPMQGEGFHVRYVDELIIDHVHVHQPKSREFITEHVKKTIVLP